MLKPLTPAQAIEQAEMILSVVESLVGSKEDLHDVRGDELAMLLSMVREILTNVTK
ncbi:hypothetical protein ACEWBT_23640 [Vibrio parahaemolyticus]|uniref:hypothetical protein n=1 Tax=Vibrio parahaemolyticus TaxID=670 RepID=UPI0015DE5E4B|nr:hypothetical protein [Vibrio parahaemolyticus]MCZ5987192.1 hypothetical protein [Vibrio parahaemolyticus]MCZ6288918.1 hypothetical protein [Vibrio parahaemolyticus]MDF4423069.1 hypothetical protein [Vibrio parahaemolyticus]MDG3032585.1 hypothetical protein [Vibrio parahaemolyticus]MEA5284424.1 hypothetical protein [Vibrio parahaemolyticus]